MSINHNSSDEMRTLIIELLAKYAGEPNQHAQVIREYSQRMMLSQAEHGSASRLWHTNERFVLSFGYEMNKKIASAQCLSTSSVDIPDLQAQLKETAPSSSRHLPEPTTPSLSGQPSQDDVIRLVENMVENVVEDMSEAKPPPKAESTKRVRIRAVENPHSGSNKEGRKCWGCGVPKAKGSGENNVHNTFNPIPGGV